MRSLGMRHCGEVPSRPSNSLHLAPASSPGRTAVNARRRIASFMIGAPSAPSQPIRTDRTAARLVTAGRRPATFIGAIARVMMAAGSSEQIPVAIPNTNTAEIRCRNLRAVSMAPRFSTSRKAASTMGAVIVLTGFVPRVGKTSFSISCNKCAPCRSFHFGLLRPCQSRATTSNVRAAAGTNLACLSASPGSILSRKRRRARSRRSRASTMLTSG